MPTHPRLNLVSMTLKKSLKSLKKQTKLSGYEQDEIEAFELQKSDEQNTKCLDTWICSVESEDSAWQQSNWGEYKQLSLWKSTPTLNSSSDINSQMSPSIPISETTDPNQENLTSSQWDFLVLAHQTQEAEQDSNIQLHLFGGKDLEYCSKLNPSSVLWNNSHGVIRRGLRTILATLYMAGYSFEIETVSARELGASHQRLRLFIISYPDEQLELYQQTCWSDQMREMVQRQRVNCSWLSVKRRGNGSNYGFSEGLVCTSVTNRTPGRIRARYLAGRTVTPGQAAVALRRVLYLDSLSSQATW